MAEPLEMATNACAAAVQALQASGWVVHTLWSSIPEYTGERVLVSPQQLAKHPADKALNGRIDMYHRRLPLAEFGERQPRLTNYLVGYMIKHSIVLEPIARLDGDVIIIDWAVIHPPAHAADPNARAQPT